MVWAVAAAMAAAVAIAITAPFLRARGTGAAPAAAYDLRVYRAQLAEVERDLARGILDPADAARLRTEIGRKVLEADRALARETAPAGRGRRGWPAAAVALAAVLLAIAAFALYQRLGQPGMPDEPIARRIAAAEAVYAARPSQAEAEATAAATRPPPAGEPSPDYLKLVEQLRAAVARRPDDPQGLALLAQNEARLGRMAEAAAAQRRLVEVRGAAATAADHAGLAGLMVEAAGGIITAEAEAEIARALALDPSEPQARYLQGLLMIQNQRPDRAFPIWRALLEADPSAPWAAPIRQVIGDLAWFAGEPGYEPPPPGAAAGTAPAPGPDASAVAAAGEMSAEDREQMIRGMVQGLEMRLSTEGGTPEEWARLIGALGVLGEADHAREILAEARTRFAADADGLAAIEAAARQAGLE